MSISMDKKLRTRIASGLTMAAVLIACLYISIYTFICIILLLTLLGAWEYQNLIQKYPYNQHHTPTEEKWLLMLVSSIVYLLIAGTAAQLLELKQLAWILPIIFCLFLKELFAGAENPFVRVGFNLIALAYIALPFGLMIAVANYNNTFNPNRIFGIFALLWANDVMAYFTGKAFGKTPLFKRVSPNKTWEGSMGGGLSTLLIAIILGQLFPQAFSTTVWLGIGLIVAVFGSLGDLVESLFKRSIGVKDSGNIMPGHGGILDRFDAVIFAMPFIYAFLILVKA